MGTIDVLGEMSRLVAERAVSEMALAAMTGVDQEKLHSALIASRSTPTTMVSAGSGIFGIGETLRVSMLAGLLTEGMTVGDDERLTSILESLTIESHLTPENIARLTGVDAAELESALNDPGSMASETKYVVALRTSYLINAINMVRALPRTE